MCVSRNSTGGLRTSYNCIMSALFPMQTLTVNVTVPDPVEKERRHLSRCPLSPPVNRTSVTSVHFSAVELAPHSTRGVTQLADRLAKSSLGEAFREGSGSKMVFLPGGGWLSHGAIITIRLSGEPLGATLHMWSGSASLLDLESRRDGRKVFCSRKSHGKLRRGTA